MTEEDEAQSDIIALIGWIAPSVIAFAIPNKATRTKGGRAGNAVPGLRKGVWDIGMILPLDCDFPGYTAYCEVKSSNGSLSHEQKDFREILIGRDIPNFIAQAPNHLDQVRHPLSLWRVKTREAPRHLRAGERAEAP